MKQKKLIYVHFIGALKTLYTKRNAGSSLTVHIERVPVRANNFHSLCVEEIRITIRFSHADNSNKKKNQIWENVYACIGFN